MKKGNVTTSQLVTWAIALAVFALGSIYTANNIQAAKIEQVKADVAQTVTDIAVLGVKSDQYKEDITLINRKLDTLLIDRGYSPQAIEKAVVSEKTQ